MSDVDHLRRVLLDHETSAPDATGIIEAAHAGAVRLRRRQRRRHIGLAAALTIAVAVGAVIPLSGANERTAQEPPQRRGPAQVTIELDPGRGVTASAYGVIGTAQYMGLLPSAPDVQVSVLVHDPDTFNPGALPSGEPVTVKGRTAHFVPDLTIQLPGWGGDPIGPLSPTKQTVPAIGWSDASGSWVVVYSRGPATKADLLKVAEAVRLRKPRDVVAPYGLTYVPPGLRPVYTLNVEDHPTSKRSVIGFDPDAVDLSTARELSLTIDVMNRDAHRDGRMAGLGQPTATLAGRPAWYVTDRGYGWMIPEGGSMLFVQDERCQYMLSVRDRAAVPYEELKRMVEGARFADCTNFATWTPVLPA
jgi:hypothetical protein